MRPALNQTTTRDQRRFVRVDVTGNLEYRHAPNESGCAVLHDIGRGGLGLRLGRYLSPGRRVMVTLEETEPGHPVELKAVVAWCRPTGDGRTYLAGLRLFYDESSTFTVVSRLLRRAVFEEGAPCPSGTGSNAADAWEMDQWEVRNPNSERSTQRWYPGSQGLRAPFPA